MSEASKYYKNDSFNEDKKRVEELYLSYQKEFGKFCEKYPLKKSTWAMTAGNTISSFIYNGSKEYNIKVSYGYNNYYPDETYTTDDERFHISQVGTFDFNNMMFYPEIGENVEIEIGKQIEVEHDVVAGLPVYLKVLES